MFILGLILSLGISYLCVAGLSWVIIWALGAMGLAIVSWSWLNAFYFWIAYWAVNILFGRMKCSFSVK